MSQARTGVQVSFRCSRESADVLAELAQRQTHGMRGLIMGWLAQAGYADVAQQDLARPDGRRRRRMLAETSQELATGVVPRSGSTPCTGFLSPAHHDVQRGVQRPVTRTVVPRRSHRLRRR
jgi:hypothetical protein